MEETNILSIDLDYVQNDNQEIELLNFFLKTIKNCKKLIFIKSHQQILHYIHEIKKINLFNVDHHHDIFYDDVNTEAYREGNWILYLLKNNNLNSYTWIHNFNSDIKTESIHPVRNLKKFYTTTSLDLIKNFKYSFVIICESMDYSKKSCYIYEKYKIIANNFFRGKTIIDIHDNFSSHIVQNK